MPAIEHDLPEWRRTSDRRVSSFDAVWLLVLLAQLVLIWAFPRVPTQDGPVHVASAIAFRDLHQPGTAYAELFERRLEIFPNWTSHLLLAGLSRVLDPGVSEKLVICLWFLLWPWGARRLAASVGADRATLTGVALLLAFGRAFWLGFYGFLLGVAVALLVAGWTEDRRRAAGVRHAALLVVAFLALYFTHLASWVLAVALALAFAAVSADRARRIRLLVLALVPSLACVVLFAGRSGVGRPARAAREPVLAMLQLEWFDAHASSWALLLTVATLGALLLNILTGARNGGEGTAVRRVLLAAGGAAFLVLALGPPDLGAQAGYFKARLALVAPVLVLAGLRAPRSPALRGGALLLLVGLNAANLAFVASFLSSANRDLREFTAAAEEVGRGKTLFLVSPKDPDAVFDYVNPNLYCFGTGNAVATNYQAGTRHFPLRYRPGVRKAAREMANGSRPPWTDVVVVWEGPRRGAPRLPGDYVERYRRGRLRVFARRASGPSKTPDDPAASPE